MADVSDSKSDISGSESDTIESQPSADELEESPGRDIHRVEDFLQSIAGHSEVVMDVFELSTAFIMIVLFGIGVFDLLIKLVELVENGTYTNPEHVIKLIDTALLLLIIVEVYRTVVAYVEDLNILPIVLNVGIIAMARKVISFRTSKYATESDALVAAGSYALMLLTLIVAFYLIHRIQHTVNFNIYAAGENEEDARG